MPYKDPNKQNEYHWEDIQRRMGIVKPGNPVRKCYFAPGRCWSTSEIFTKLARNGINFRDGYFITERLDFQAMIEACGGYGKFLVS